MNKASGKTNSFSQHKLLYRITVSAVFLALAVVLKLTTTFYLPIMGASGLKIDFSGVFSAFPSILFGPWYGGAVCAAADLLGYVLKPSGAFIPALTVTQFLSGFLVGIAAAAVKKLAVKEKSRAKSIIASVCAVLFLFTAVMGILFCASLNGDGLIDGFNVEQENLPLKGEINSRTESKDISVLSRIVCSLARYANDSLTLTAAAENADKYIVPDYIEVSGLDTKVTSIGAGCFEDCTSLETVYIPSTVTSIDGDAFNTFAELTVCTTEGSYTQQFASENGINCSALSAEEYQAQLDELENAASDFEYTSNDNYRKNLAGYIIFMTFGLMGIGIIGAVIVIVGMLIKRKDGFGGYAVFFAVIALPRLLITTVNTEILRRTLAVWNGRAFWVLLIPRLGEELVSCLIQAYIISLLYTIYTTRIAKNNNLDL